MTILAPGAGSLRLACEHLACAKAVALPTETVYGLAVDATSCAAVQEVYRLKRRPAANPLIIHVASMQAALALGRFNRSASALARRFWPGQLTLVVPLRKPCAISAKALAQSDTIALRVPSHPVALDVLRLFARPLAAPSANRSGRPSPTSAAHVAADFGHDGLPLILDGGATALGLESTVVAAVGDPCSILRTGALTRKAIEAQVGELAPDGASPIASPGRRFRHYAPKLPVRLNVQEVREGEALLTFGTPHHRLRGAVARFDLSARGNVEEAAARLFSGLRSLERSGAHGIAVMPVPSTGIGEAINDRLRRAALLECEG